MRVRFNKGNLQLSSNLRDEIAQFKAFAADNPTNALILRGERNHVVLDVTLIAAPEPNFKGDADPVTHRLDKADEPAPVVDNTDEEPPVKKPATKKATAKKTTKKASKPDEDETKVVFDEEDEQDSK